MAINLLPHDHINWLAKCQHLVPFCRWLNLTHTNTYIHGPFNFATVNRHKSCDRISWHDWDILVWHPRDFQNPPPWFDLPSYSIHADLGIQISFCDPSHIAPLYATSNVDSDCLIPRQKVWDTPLFFQEAAKRDLADLLMPSQASNSTRWNCDAVSIMHVPVSLWLSSIFVWAHKINCLVSSNVFLDLPCGSRPDCWSQPAIL